MLFYSVIFYLWQYKFMQVTNFNNKLPIELDPTTLVHKTIGTYNMGLLVTI